jgi:hypothetical protein
MTMPAVWPALVAPVLAGRASVDDLAVAQDCVAAHGGIPCRVHPALPPFFEWTSHPAPALMASFTAMADPRLPGWVSAERARHDVAELLRRVGRPADALTVEALEPIHNRAAATSAAQWVTPDWVRGLRSLSHSAALGSFRRLCALLGGAPDPRRVAARLGQRMLRVHQRLAQALEVPLEPVIDSLFIDMVRACLPRSDLDAL